MNYRSNNQNNNVFGKEVGHAQIVGKQTSQYSIEDGRIIPQLKGGIGTNCQQQKII